MDISILTLGASAPKNPKVESHADPPSTPAPTPTPFSAHLIKIFIFIVILAIHPELLILPALL
jgi:hypothetical protein